MRNPFHRILVLSLLAILTPCLALAHQPRVTDSRVTAVADPEISKAYYGTLAGEPDSYVIRADGPFDLYVNVLVPDIAGQRKDVSATVLRDGAQIALLDGPSFAWTQFYEPFGADTYWMGPEYKARAEAGTYEIRVSSPDNAGKYSLAIGETEAFGGTEGLRALTVIPELKRDFFNESPVGFIRSPFGWGLIAAMYLLAGIVGLAYRALLRRFAKGTVRGMGKNIGTPDRLVRLVIALGLLLLAVTTSWNPVLIFFSGFVLFESVFSWCGLYAALGKKTCPSPLIH